MSNNRKLGLVNINAYTKFDLKIEWKQNYDRWKESQFQYSPTFQMGAGYK